MGLHEMFHKVWDRHERQTAANTTAILTEGLGALLESLADDAMRDAELDRPTAVVIAMTYRDAATRVRISGIDLAETIRP